MPARLTGSALVRAAMRAGAKEDPVFWTSVAQRTRELLPQLAPAEISALSFSLARAGRTELLPDLASSAIPVLTLMTIGDLSHLLAGFGRAEVRNDLLFDLAAREVGRQIHKASLADLANIALAFSKLNYHHPLLFEVITKRVVLIAPNTTDVKSIAVLAKTAVLDHPKMAAVLAAEICRRIDQFPAASLAAIASGYAKVRNVFLMEVLLDESFHRRHEFGPSGIAQLVDAVVHQPKAGLLVDFFVSDLSKRGLKNFDLHSLATFLSGVAAHYESADGTATLTTLFQMAGDRVAAAADQLNPQSIAKLAKAFASVGVRHGPLLFNLPLHVQAAVGEFSLSELATVMRAYAQLGIRNDTLLAVVPSRCLALLAESPKLLDSSSGSDTEIFAISTNLHSPPSLQVAAMVDLVEAYAMLLVSETPLLESLVERIEINRHLLTPGQIEKTIPNSLQMLGIPLPHQLLHAHLTLISAK